MTRLGDDSEQFRVRISDPGEVAAALPHLLGFRPRESIVLVGLVGATGRVGLTVRADVPAAEATAALAGTLADSIATDDPASVLVAVVSEAPDEPGPSGLDLPHRGLLHAQLLALAERDIPVRDGMLVRDGRWWSYDCRHPCCAPGAGTPLPSGVSALEAASVATGQVVAGDRAELLARIAPVGEPARSTMEALAWRVGDRYARAALADREAVARRSWTTILRAVARCRASHEVAAAPLPDRDVAQVLWALSDVLVRDRALGLAVGEDAAAAEALWTECTRRAPAPLDAAPATLLAVSAWLRGDGAMANVALDRALASRPSYRLARLLRDGLAACLPPEELRTMVRGVAADLAADDSAGGGSAAAGRAPWPSDGRVRAARGAATPPRARARRGKRAPSRTRRSRGRG